LPCCKDRNARRNFEQLRRRIRRNSKDEIKMKTTNQLSHDHQVILRGLEVLKAVSTAWKSDPLMKDKDCRSILEFFKTFADRCHHGKEEKVLFPKLSELGIPVEDGPLGVMVREHDEGRLLLRSMEQALAEKHPSDFALYADHYVRLLQEHIAKEDNVLFAKADEVLSIDDDEELFHRFGDIEKEMGEDTHERFHKMLDALSSSYRVHC
jgi:hemerythrin-like domain-containing protein